MCASVHTLECNLPPPLPTPPSPYQYPLPLLTPPSPYQHPLPLSTPPPPLPTPPPLLDFRFRDHQGSRLGTSCFSCRRPDRCWAPCGWNQTILVFDPKPFEQLLKEVGPGCDHQEEHLAVNSGPAGWSKWFKNQRHSCLPLSTTPYCGHYPHPPQPPRCLIPLWRRKWLSIQDGNLMFGSCEKSWKGLVPLDTFPWQQQPYLDVWFT